MKIVIISDTHNQLSKMNIPDGDILIHAGDATGRGREYEIEDFNAELGALPHKVKIFVPGNHDWLFQTNETKARSLMTNAIVLIDELIEINGLKIYGSPWQPRFYDWAFNVNRGDAIAQKWASIPEGLDILITHGPAFGILDDTINGMRVGCEELYKKIFEVKPKYHVSGHIHFGYGMRELDGITFINASNLGEDYRYHNKPIQVYI